MPWSKFESIKTPKDLEEFFQSTFPDSIPLIGLDLLIENYFKNEKGALMSLKVFLSSVLISVVQALPS